MAPPPGQRADLVSQVAELQAARDGMRATHVELQERVDFAERLLSQFRDQARIAPGDD